MSDPRVGSVPASQDKTVSTYGWVDRAHRLLSSAKTEGYAMPEALTFAYPVLDVIHPQIMGQSLLQVDYDPLELWRGGDDSHLRWRDALSTISF